MTTFVDGQVLTAAQINSAFAAAATANNAAAAAAAASASTAAALVSGLSSGTLGYSTLALLNADIAHPAGTVALVTNDTTIANNIFYTKSGVSGSGSWTAASASLLNSILATQAAAAPSLATLHTDYSRAGYKYAVIDASNNIALAVDAAGNLIAGNGGNISTQLAALAVLKAAYGSSPSARSGYQFAIVDSANNMALGITNAGQVVIDGQNFPALVNAVATNTSAIAPLSTQPSARSGYQFAILDILNQMPFGINNAGQVIIQGQNISALAGSLNSFTTQLAALNSAVTPAGFIAVGDSLTAGAGGTPYPTQLSALLGVSVQNIGVGGQISTSISGRFGGNTVPFITVTGNQIPASGAVTVTAQSFYLQTNQGPGGLLGTLGGVAGTLTSTAFDGNGNPTTTTFTRTIPGNVVKLNTLTPFFIDTSDNRLNKTAIIWLGRNNLTATATVLADTANAIAGMKCLNKQFVVMGILSGVTEGSGTANYTNIQSVNSQLRALYPNNYIDIRETLVNASNPALPYDAQCIAADTPGPSLHAAYTGGSLSTSALATDTTLNFTGYTLTSGSVILIGTEYISIGTVAGSAASGCTRGYGGTTAAAYSNGTTFSVMDGIHLSTSGYAVIAQTVFNFLTIKGWLT